MVDGRTLDIAAARAALQDRDLRRLGIPNPIMSNAEFHGALARDRAGEVFNFDEMGGYDRRGLLNVIAWLLASPLDVERLARALNELDDGDTLVCVRRRGRDFDRLVGRLPDESLLSPRAVAELIAKADGHLLDDARRDAQVAPTSVGGDST